MGALIEVNTDGLAKLGETISYGLGLTAFGRKKMANAEYYAAIKQAETDTQVELLKLKGEEEVANYVLAREARKMDNAKSVVEKAKGYLLNGEPISNEPVNVDWTNRFFRIVEDISDETLHNMWGSILAGEVKRPNSYSLRTLEMLKNVTKEEAELFIKASHFYLDDNDICTEQFTLSLNETLLLAEAGFINSEELSKNFTVEPKSSQLLAVDKNILLVLHNDNDRQIKFYISVKKISIAGIELLSLTEKPDRKDFCDSLAHFIKSKGISRVLKHEILQSDRKNVRYKAIGEEIK